MLKNNKDTVSPKAPKTADDDANNFHTFDKEKKDERKHTSFHVSDQNGKKITEITTTTIIEENSHNAADKRQSNDKCDIVDMTNDHFLKRDLGEENEKDGSMIKVHHSSNKTPRVLLAGGDLSSITTNHVDHHHHEINSDSKSLYIKQQEENENHEMNSYIKNETAHLLEVKSKCIIPLDNKTMSNTSQQLAENDKQPQSQGLSVDLKDDHTNTTIKVLVEIPKTDVMKSINVSSIVSKPSVKNITMTETDNEKPVPIDLNKNVIKEVATSPIIQELNTIISNKNEPQVTIAPIKIISEKVNITDSNITKISNDKKSKDLDIERIKMSIKVEMNTANKSVPADYKNMTTASVIHNDNGTHTSVDIDVDGEKNGEFFKIFCTIYLFR